ncbi:hypothetical protein [Candidatus Electronema sp. JM]|uniref:hypothetical protein n=1 Tax=Candidatus Electronema sp. JM TaxID=3401571 RepID=UPI003AA7D2AF
MMKKTIYAALSCAAAALLLPAAGRTADSVCSSGVGIPPFLSSGAKPNLLMVLDNSGSMLDAAYSKQGLIYQANGTTPVMINNSLQAQYQRCMDGDYDIVDVSSNGTRTNITTVTGYDNTYSYGGYFKNDAWYTWADVTDTYRGSEWKSGTAYTVNTRVQAFGNIYEATTAGTSNGTTIDKDTGVTWRKLSATVPSLTQWGAGITYPPKSFTWYGPQLYYTAAGGTSTGTALTANTGVTDWKPVEHTWMSTESYSSGKIVSYKGILYQSLVGSNQNNVPGKDSAKWQSLRQGGFTPLANAPASATAACSGNGTKYTRTDALCLTIDTAVTPTKVTSFVARGNFLNWATASKFDIEKKILTGGKHNYYEQVLVAEHRGCSGSRMMKQVKMVKASDSTVSYLTLGVRGGKYEDDSTYFRKDRVDSSDDTTRLEVMAVTALGMQISGQCQDMLDTILNKDPNGANWGQPIDSCLATMPANNTDITKQRPMLNHSLQFCSKWWKDQTYRNISNVATNCAALYSGNCANNQTPCTSWTTPPYPSSTLQPAYGAYICYGIYDSNITNPAQRAGYVGRCWQPAQGTMMTCIAKPAVPAPNGNNTGPGCDMNGQATECTYSYGGAFYKNTKTPSYNYKCTKSTLADCATSDWVQQFIWNDGSNNSCTNEGQTQTGNAVGGQWEGQTGNSNQLATAVENCIVDASIAYCQDTALPEVIDPSDQAGDTTKTWNVPGVVSDSGIISLMGGDYPIATMKGYIQQTARPQGILHNVQRDLRLGVMAFNNVGASTECQTNYVTPGVTRYCPTGNQDGAKLLAKLEAGDFIVDATDTEYPGNKRRHVDDMAAAINDVRGTSWTPLAEALYTALGYYTQNDAFRLRDTKDSNNKYLDFCVKTDTNGTCTDYALDKDPVQYWCQDNHILLITEGESTTDVNPAVVKFASAPTTVDQTTFFPSKKNGDVLTGDGTAEPTPTTTTTPVTGPCKDTLFRSTYLDDMTWWGQNVWPTYKSRYFIDPDGNPTQKQNISTYVVATSKLNTTAASGAVEECKPETLLRYAASKGGTNSYYPGENPDQLEKNLYAVLDDILSRASAGSAASVISSSRSGSGAVYQAVFWPKHQDQSTPTNKVSWVGDVHSLFVSSAGLMYEDTNQNGKLDAGEDANGNGKLDAGEDLNGNGTLDAGADKRVLFYFSTKANRTRGCYDIQGFYTNNMQCPGEPDATPSTPDPRCPATNSSNCVEITDINYLWSANKRLAKMDVLNERKIWTWNDANNNGRVDDGEQFLLTELASYYNNGSKINDTITKSTDSGKLTALNTVAQSSGRGPISRDFLTSADLLTFAGYTPQGATENAADYAKRRERESLDGLVTWIQGVDSVTTDETTDANNNKRLDKVLRSRAFNLISDDPSDPTNQLSETWRLGDIIHSTPILVAKPAEAYHYIYRDPTYRDFVERWKGRRNMIYFGSNDGMLHAVNGGFYLESNGGQFCCAPPEADGTCATSNQPNKGSCGTGGKALGQELWAYLPYNLQPHMKCLADKYYAHKYYVDQKPRIFDVQIFEPESACNGGVTAAGCIHPGGWGTILVGSMRFGGAPVKAKDLLDVADSNYNSENRQFTSAYFVLDITDPDAATPRLLGEMTQVLNGSNTLYADMGYTTSSPSLVTMRSSYPNADASGGMAESTGNVKSDWYLVLGNGPTELDGSHAPQGKIAVMPLSWLNGEVTDWNNGWPKTFQAKTDWKQFRIPNTAPTSGSEAGVFTLPTNGGTINSSFISDIIAVDYNINLTAPDDRGARYRTDAIYFGTIDGSAFEPYPPGYLNGIAGQYYWKKGGRVFRMVTKKLNPNGIETAAKPSDWPGMWNDTADSLKYNNGPLRQLADVQMPVIGAPSIGYDGDNFWVYAGTGRFFSEQDKADDGWCLPGASANCDQQGDRSKIGFFGLKEPLKDELSSFDYWATLPPSSLDYKYNPMMTWARIEWDINKTDNQNANLSAQTAPPAKAPGKRGLMQTDKIIVADVLHSPHVDANGNALSSLSCYNCKTSVTNRTQYTCTEVISTDADYCFPTNVMNSISVKGRKATDTGTSPLIDVPIFEKLRKYIAGTGFMTVDGKNYTTGLDGWYRDFHDARERNLGTSALLGGLLTYTTYQPYNDICKAEGESSLYGVHYQTGTAWIENVFGTFDLSCGASGATTCTGITTRGTAGGAFVMDKLSLGRGLSTTPSMHVGTGDSAAKAFIQTSTGEIIEVSQENLPIKKTKSGRQNWTDRCSQ